jgi:twinkle protein
VLQANPEEVYIVEGELDACALVEAGIPATQVLGAHGAKDKPTEGDPIEQPGYAYVVDALKAGLGRVKKFIWCGDADGAGRILRDDMVRMLGAARFYFVEWPEGVKDANDVLLSDGMEPLGDLVQNGSLPWPVVDIYQLSGLPEPAPVTLWYPGSDEWWERKADWRRGRSASSPATPGSWQTALWNQIWFNVIKRYEVDLTDEERGARCLDQRSFFSGAPDQPADAGVVSRGGCDLRHGVPSGSCTSIPVTDWRRHAGERDDGYVLRCLRTLYQFATDMNCHVQVLAHPARMQ